MPILRSNSSFTAVLSASQQEHGATAINRFGGLLLHFSDRFRLRFSADGLRNLDWAGGIEASHAAITHLSALAPAVQLHRA